MLVVAINRVLEDESQPLDVRRDRAVFRLAAEKLAEAKIAVSARDADAAAAGVEHVEVVAALDDRIVRGQHEPLQRLAIKL